MSAVEIAAGVRGGALRGAIYVLAAGLCWSFTGIFLRLAPHFDPWQFLAWRSFGTACAIAIIARVGGHGRLARRLFALGRVGAIVTLAFAVASITFIISMKTTTVANALFLSSCAPLLAAILGYLVLGEKLSLWQSGLHRTRAGRPLDHRQRWTRGGKPDRERLRDCHCTRLCWRERGNAARSRSGLFACDLRLRARRLHIFGAGLSWRGGLPGFAARRCRGGAGGRPAANGTGLCLLPARRATRSGGGADGAGADRDDIRSRLGLARVRRGASGADSDRRRGHPRCCGLDGRGQFGGACSAGEVAFLTWEASDPLGRNR